MVRNCSEVWKMEVLNVCCRDLSAWKVKVWKNGIVQWCGSVTVWKCRRWKYVEVRESIDRDRSIG